MMLGNLSREKFGVFDVVLCAGILYHLNVPDLVGFIEKMAQVTRNLLIIDTHIAQETLRENHYELGKMVTEVVGDYEYRGRYFTEHHPDSSLHEKEQRLWASADNDEAFWLTRASLHGALRNHGFGSVYEAPQDWSRPIEDVDRLTFIAVK